MYINPNNQFDSIGDVVSLKIINLLKEAGTEMTIESGQTIIKEGQLCDFFFIVVSGSFRAYRYINDHEVIIGFSFKGDIDTAPYAFVNKQHSTENIEAITKSKIIKIHRSTFDNLAAENPEMDNFILNLLARYTEILIKRHLEFKIYTAEHIYLLLHKRQQEEIHKIPLKYIASYLGISPQRLSRIRNKLK
ncbi:Crp/Fnr family transcriptional regulator [Flavobacterium arcticum]|uniref:Crp/Fnr family transcriptional regulator n=1 Tax=Flavobacterium arcticum TaxID=1784713 RepID=A0A345HDK1_9FLAO|nr:Crp/Fnr family transcriptional regulator [Flavobacterium arcticum]AXG74661.1 Crp/Fnr family transcriptional regulator [Flavobacterium arcticum]KAF2512213.1 Crp/Fnr family transcriptional regulator [Flavobacterium arcticum]